MRDVMQLIGAAFIAGCAIFVVNHLRYLSSQTQPATSRFHQELATAEAALHATPLTPAEITDKGLVVFAEQGVRFAPFGSKLPHNQALAAIGWRYAREDGVGSEFCKNNLVLTVSNSRGNEGFLQIEWGNADAFCQ